MKARRRMVKWFDWFNEVCKVLNDSKPIRLRAGSTLVSGMHKTRSGSPENHNLNSNATVPTNGGV